MSTATSKSVDPRELRRSRLRIIAIWGLFIALFAAAAFASHRMHILKNRSLKISSGMPRDQVEELLGKPYLILPKIPKGSGDVMVWTDHIWQVDVVIDGNGKVLWCSCVPANSAYRRTQSKLSSLFQ